MLKLLAFLVVVTLLCGVASVVTIALAPAPFATAAGH